MGESVPTPDAGQQPNSKILPIVDPYVRPYEHWKLRKPTPDEIWEFQSTDSIKEELLETVRSALDAACLRAREEAPRLQHHIDEQLKQSDAYQRWESLMPSKTPAAIAKYQTSYAKADFVAVSAEIEQYGAIPTTGQRFFHGGSWPESDTFETERPLSTTLDPNVAFQNALYKGKAFKAGRIDLWVIEIDQPKTKAFVFKPKGTKMAHEKEVLFGSGAALTKLALNQTNVLQLDIQGQETSIPVNVLQIRLS